MFSSDLTLFIRGERLENCKIYFAINHSITSFSDHSWPWRQAEVLQQGESRSVNCDAHSVPYCWYCVTNCMQALERFSRFISSTTLITVSSLPIIPTSISKLWLIGKINAIKTAYFFYILLRSDSVFWIFHIFSVFEKTEFL